MDPSAVDVVIDTVRFVIIIVVGTTTANIITIIRHNMMIHIDRCLKIDVFLEMYMYIAIIFFTIKMCMLTKLFVYQKSLFYCLR